MTRDPSGAMTMADTVPLSAVGFQGRSAPFVAENAARLVRVAPPADEHPPPRNTSELDAAMPSTDPPTDGANVGTRAPVATSNAAMCGRDWPSTVVKSPPM